MKSLKIKSRYRPCLLLTRFQLERIWFFSKWQYRCYTSREKPIGRQRDVVRPFDRQQHSRRKTRGSRTQDYRAKRLFLFHSLAPNCSQCWRHGPLHRQMVRRCACACVRVCVSEKQGVCAPVCVCERWVVTPFGFVQVWEMERERYKGRKLKREKHCRGVCVKESSDSLMQALIRVLFLFIFYLFFIPHPNSLCTSLQEQ